MCWPRVGKMLVLGAIKFTMCFENGCSDGYHTEKLVHAKMAGCIPVYWANKTIEHEKRRETFERAEKGDKLQCKNIYKEKGGKLQCKNI